MKSVLIVASFSIVFVLTTNSCIQNKSSDIQKEDVIHTLLNGNLNLAVKQFDQLLHLSLEEDKIPRTLKEDGQSIKFVKNDYDWTAGFFPGICWQMYTLTEEEKYLKAAKHFQEKFMDHRTDSSTHDLGFVFNNSYGKAYELLKIEEDKKVLIDAANALVSRYNENVGAIKSWDVTDGWKISRKWEFPVIIDNMMNLELLFNVTNLTADSAYYWIAVNHANRTLENHFRQDYSSYHVVDYNPVSGEVVVKETHQGYAHESSWARGQAWALYGYTMCYRYTNNPDYLEAAKHIATFILDHPNLPEDLVPYWDFDAPRIPGEPKDASAAAITASALLELDGYCAVDYLEPALRMLKSLASEDYMEQGENNNRFILKHSVGNYPAGKEIDVPLIYADYYFIEALYRLKKTTELQNNELTENKH